MKLNKECRCQYAEEGKNEKVQTKYSGNFTGKNRGEILLSGEGRDDRENDVRYFGSLDSRRV